MRKSYLLIVVLTMISVPLFAQNTLPSVSIGVEVARPAYFYSALESSNATGIGLDIKRRWSISPKLSWTAGLGFTYFSGSYTYYSFSNTAKDSSVRNYAIMPLLIGMRYQFTKGFYLSGEAGLAIGAGSRTGTAPLLAPSAGLMLPSKNATFDISIKLTNAINWFGSPESNSLQKGGYGYWSFRIAYTFGHAKPKH